jgi:hypothetical protein
MEIKLIIIITIMFFTMLVGVNATGGITFDDKLSTFVELRSNSEFMETGYFTGLATGLVSHNRGIVYTPTLPADLLPDNATNGSYPYFGWDRGVWHNLTLNITVPVSADNFTVKWQYLSGYLGNLETEWTDLNVTEDTCGNFSTTGLCNVDFEVPTTWDLLYLFSSPFGSAMGAIRARVMNSTGITEGGEFNYIDGNSYAIVSRGTADDMEDIIAEEIAGNWEFIETLNDSISIFKITHVF